MRVKILVDDLMGRFSAGEEGVLLVNDSIKYDYFVELPGALSTPFGAMKRQLYFYKDEVAEIA